MRSFYFALISGLLLVGCSTPKGTVAGKPTTTSNQPTIAQQKAASTKGPKSSLTVTNGADVITLANTVTGKVASVNLAARFVVLDYSLSALPAPGDQLNVYRQGAKVGVVKVSGPTLNNNTVADIVAGEAQIGDDVRKE